MKDNENRKTGNFLAGFGRKDVDFSRRASDFLIS